MSADLAPCATDASHVSPPTRFRSAERRPQGCGKPAAATFDVEGLVDWLRRQFPTATGANVEARTGIPTATEENWLQRRAPPTVAHFSVLIATFGPALIRASLSRPPEWVEAAVRRERVQEIEAEIARLRDEQTRMGGPIAA